MMSAVSNIIDKVSANISKEIKNFFEKLAWNVEKSKKQEKNSLVGRPKHNFTNCQEKTHKKMYAYRKRNSMRCSFICGQY